MSVWSQRCGWLAFALAIGVATGAGAQGVFVQAKETGQGIMRARGDDCFVLTPLHVIGETLGPVRVVGERATEGKAELMREFPGDLALLRLVERGTLRCDPFVPPTNFSGMLQSQTGGYITTREPDGSRTLMPVAFRSIDADRVYVRPTVAGDQLLKGMSGASLVVNGTLAGMLLSVADGDGNVLRLDDLMRLTDSFFATATSSAAPATTRVVDIAAASALLDRAVAARDGSMQGQVAAVADLLGNGHQFSSVDWSGVSMKGGQLANAVFASGRFHFTDFTDADLRGSNLSKAGLRFAYIVGATLSGANLSEAFAPFVDARRANLEGAILSAGNFAGADFRGARLQKADLRGASLAWADLRGANLDGANLTGAYLQGTVVDAMTSFKDAVFNDTDVSGATLATQTLTAQQYRGVCRHLPAGRQERPVEMPLTEYTIRLLEQWASPRFSTGLEFEDLPSARWAFGVLGERWLPLCKSKPNEVATSFDARFPGSMQLNLDRSYLSKAGRAREAVRRVNEHLELLKEQLRAEVNLQPERERRARWDAAVKSAAAKATPNGTPYVDSDTFLLYLLARNAIDANQVDWIAQARNRFMWEDQVRNPSPRQDPMNSMWASMFPEGVSWQAIVDAAPAYKAWTLERAKRLPGTVTFAARIPEAQYRAAQAGLRVHQVFMHGSSLRGDGYEFLKTRNIEQARLGEAKPRLSGQIYGPPGAPNTPSLAPFTVFPNPLSEYLVPLTPGVTIDGAVLELDGTVTGVEKLSDHVALSITPTAARLIRDGKTVWSGSLELAPQQPRRGR